MGYFDENGIWKRYGTSPVTDAYWQISLKDAVEENSHYEVEYGGSARFAQVEMLDADYRPVLCKCGNPAACALIGKESQAAYCSDCMPMDKSSLKLQYKPPTDDIFTF